jgi:hypothetical protein
VSRLHKFFLFFLILFSVIQIQISTSHAFEPIIIDKADPVHPGNDGDQNYLPVDPNTIPLEKITRQPPILQTFDPIRIGTSDGGTIFAHQTINKVEQEKDIAEFTNLGFRQIFSHLANKFPNPFAPKDEISKTFKSLNPNTPIGASNMARRALPYNVEKCLISRRMIQAANSLQNPKGTTVDIIIATAPHQIRISEVAAYLKNDDSYFYDPNQDCTPASLPVGIPSKTRSILNSHNFNFAPDDIYQQLYKYAIEPVEANSYGVIYENCDLDDAGNTSNCDRQTVAIPLGAAPAGNGSDVMSQIIPAKSQIKQLDHGNTEINSPIPDKPNPLSFLARFFKLFFDGELKDTVTYQGKYQLNYYMPTELKEGLETQQTGMLQLFPQKDIEANNLNDLTPSSTNGDTIDPGKSNSDINQQAHYQLTPKSWQTTQ